jgi:hypothetical protein
MCFRQTKSMSSKTSTDDESTMVVHAKITVKSTTVSDYITSYLYKTNFVQESHGDAADHQIQFSEWYVPKNLSRYRI